MELRVDPKKALLKNRVAIVRDLANGDDVADQLYTVGLFTDEMRDTVMQEPEKERKNRYILDILIRRGKNAAKGLYEAFLETQNEELAKLLAPYIRAQDSEENRLTPSIWPPLEVEQQKMEKDHVKTIQDLKSPVYIHAYTSDDKVYKMRNKVRGKVFVINNMTFLKESKLNNRPGSDVDADNIVSLFKELQFDVVRENDLHGKAMLKFLTEERNKVNWNDMECLVIVIMSHGHTTGVFGIDGEEISLKKMTDLFTSFNCPGLNEKPRLIFVQACRGEQTEVGITGTGIQESQDGDQTDATSDRVRATDETDAVGTMESEKPIQTVHSSADFLIAYATPEGTPAYRNINVGSWFLNAIVWTFKYHADELEIQHLMLRVNDLVSKGRTMKGHLTVSEIKNSLRKQFYFFPGVYDNPPKSLGS